MYFIFLLFLPIIHCKSVLLGEPSSDEAENDLYSSIVKSAVEQYNRRSNDLFKWEALSIENVNKQIVNGEKYTMRVLLTQTDCIKRGEEYNKMQCNPVDRQKRCKVIAFRRPASENFNSFDLTNCEEPFVPKPKRIQKKSITARMYKAQYVHAGEVALGNIILISSHVKPKDYAAWNMFADFMDNYDKGYPSKHVALHKFRVFKKNLRLARELQKKEKGTAVYGVTQFSDLAPEDFRKIYLPYQWQQPFTPNTMADFDALGVSIRNVPKSFDWREKGAVTEIKDQGSCGSCWAFSTTGNIEGQWFINKGKLVSLSEQELVDCDKLDQGCNGGLPSNAYKEIMRMGGMEPENAYPYDGKNEKCHIVKKDIAVYINGSVELPQDEVKMQAFLAQKGPISVGINANTLQFYRHGISHPFKILCEPFMLNHGVLIVGYGEEKKKPYWSIKNSWGARWGEQGYYRLYRGKNVCGVQEMATSSLVD